MPYRDEEANRARREKNKERMAAHSRKHYEKNKEEIKLPEWAIKLMYEIFDCIYPA